MIVLDASVLIAFLDGDDPHHARALGLLSREVDEDVAASTLTLAEVLVFPARRRRLEQAQEALRAVEVQEIPFPADAAVGLASLRADTALKLPDCCVLLVAEHTRAALATFDDRLATTAQERGVRTLVG